MSNSGKITFGRCGWAGAALAALAAAAPAYAEMPGGTRPLTPAIAASAPAAARAMPAVVSPNRQRPQQTKPAALHPQAAPQANSLPHTRQNGMGEIACRAPPRLVRLDRPLRHAAQRLAGGKPLVIVAVGSSSTAGTGASSRAATYPGRLAIELQKIFVGHDITVLNRGVGGEETAQMMARFATGVVAEHPDLVLWQLGTNGVLRDHPLRSHAAAMHEGLEELKAAGADVVLIDPQYAPRVLAKPETPGMVDLIALAAKDENVDLFHRFAIMRDWYENQHLPFETFVSRDGLHMNDWGYACWAKLLAASIADAVNAPVASAAIAPAR